MSSSNSGPPLSAIPITAMSPPLAAIPITAEPAPAATATAAPAPIAAPNSNGGSSTPADTKSPPSASASATPGSASSADSASSTSAAAATPASTGSGSLPRLSYFPLRGRAEPIRLALEDAKAGYIEDSISFREWPKKKADGIASGALPFGQLPCYVDGDLSLVQMNAILRHIGRKYSPLYGATEREHSLVDMLLDAAEELRAAYLQFIFSGHVDDNSTTAYLTHVLPPKLDAIETQMSRHKNGGAYLCTDDFSIADASVYELLDTHLHLAPSLLNKYPNLKGLHARVEARPNIASYIKTRRLKTINANGLGQRKS